MTRLNPGGSTGAELVSASAGYPPNLLNQLRQWLQALASPIPPSTTDPRVLGVDISQFNGVMDFDKLSNYEPPKFEFIVIRTGQSSSTNFDDAQFLRNWGKAKSVGLPRSTYHVLYPGLDVEPQVRHFLSLMEEAGDLGEGPFWLDVELHHGQTKKRISDATHEWLEQVTQETGHRAGVYTGKWFTDAYMEPQDWWTETDWWLATWLQSREHPGPPRLPVSVPLSACKIHQTTSFGNGKLVGAESSQIDLNRWMGTREEFVEYFNVPPQPPSDLEKRVAANEAAIADLIRRVEALEDQSGS
jgi:GH25 family lysozyme M1 (1,4-beta-N-acetylmuramidase)